MSLLESADVVKVDKAAAQQALHEYRQARAPATPEDEAIKAAYRAIARGRVLVKALASILTAGRDGEGLPRLAITRADIRRCHCRAWRSGFEISAASKRGWSSSIATFRFDNFPTDAAGPLNDGIATVPLIPLHLRPKADLKRYHILWEADWHRAPSDPLLLRKLRGDLWLVLAAWELSDVERAVLDQRVNA